MTIQRFQLVESLRTVSALLVGLYHLLLFAVEGNRLFPGMDASQLFFEFLKTTVLTFFILTAIVIPVHFEQEGYTARNYGTFLLKRLVRVHLPFLAVITLILLIEQFFLVYNGQSLHVDWFRFLANISLTAEFVHVNWYNTIFWTLAIEMQFYILIGILYPLIRKQPFWGTLGYFVGGEILHMIWPDSRFVWYYTPYFAIGIVLYFLLIKRLDKLQVLGIIVLEAATVFFLHGQIETIVAFVVPVLFLVLPDARSIFSYLGRYTYSFYLVHGLSGGLLLYFTRSLGEGTLWGIVRLLLALLFSFAASWAFYKLMEKPAMRLTHRIRYRRS